MSKLAKELTMIDKQKPQYKFNQDEKGVQELKATLSHQLVQLADYTFTINSLFNADSLHLDREYVFWRVQGLHEGMKRLVKTLDEQGLIEKEEKTQLGHCDQTPKEKIDNYLQYPTQRVVGRYTTDRHGNTIKNG